MRLNEVEHVDKQTMARAIDEELTEVSRKLKFLRRRRLYFVRDAMVLADQASQAKVELVRHSMKQRTWTATDRMKYVRDNVVRINLPYIHTRTEGHPEESRISWGAYDIPTNDKEMLDTAQHLRDEVNRTDIRIAKWENEQSRLMSIQRIHFKEAIDLTPTRMRRAPQDEIEDALSSKFKQLGKSGAYGSAYRIPGPIQTALKVGQTDTSEFLTDPHDDGYLQWIKRSYGKHNPYLPQVYKAKVFHAPDDDRFTYQVRMEELVPGSKISEHEAYDLFSRYFNYHFTEDDMLHLQKEASTMHTSMRHEYLRWVGRILQELTLGRTPRGVEITDQNFQEAIGMLRQMYKEGYIADLKGDNIAFRRTPYGLQLVILDPFNERRPSGHRAAQD